MEPFHAGAVSGLCAGELDFFILINVIVVGILRYAEGGKLVPDGFRSELGEGGRERIFHAGFLHLAEHVGDFVNGLGLSNAQFIQLGLVHIPGAGMIDVLSHEIADVVGLAVAGGDGIAGIVHVQTADIVGHDLFGQIFIQGQKQALGHAVFFHVNGVAQNHVRILAGSEHQVGRGFPVGILDDLEIDMHAGLFFNLLEEPQVVEIRLLVFQCVLDRRQIDLLFSSCKAHEGEDHAQAQKQSKQFFHGDYPPLVLLPEHPLCLDTNQPFREPIMTPLTKYFCMKM